MENGYRDLLTGIRDGKYPKDSRLPSEKELSQAYGVSRITSKRALEVPDYDPISGGLQEEYVQINHTGLKELIRQNKECSAFLCVESKLCGVMCRKMEEMGAVCEMVSFDGAGYRGDGYVTAYVRQNEKEMAVRAVKRLEQMIAGEDKKSDICVPYDIIERAGNDI